MIFKKRKRPLLPSKFYLLRCFTEHRAKDPQVLQPSSVKRHRNDKVEKEGKHKVGIKKEVGVKNKNKKKLNLTNFPHGIDIGKRSYQTKKKKEKTFTHVKCFIRYIEKCKWFHFIFSPKAWNGKIKIKLGCTSYHSNTYNVMLLKIDRGKMFYKWKKILSLGTGKSSLSKYDQFRLENEKATLNIERFPPFPLPSPPSSKNGDVICFVCNTKTATQVCGISYFLKEHNNCRR